MDRMTTWPVRSTRLLGILLLPLWLLACGGGDDPPPKLADVEVVQNGDLTRGLPLRFEPLATPRLAELRQREQLDAVVAGARDEFDAILNVKEWVARQFPHATPNPYPPWDAMTILDWIRGSQTGGFCAQYSQVLLQSLAALGLQGRYVEIGLVDNPYAHYVMEVWSNQHDKWVVLDGDYNMHFERDGVPLSALEVHQALVRSEHSDIVAVAGEFREGHDHPSRWPLQMVELYHYLRVHLKADHLSAPDETPFDRFGDAVEYADFRTTPWEFSEVDSPYAKVALTRARTGDPAEFDAKLNQTVISIDAIEKTETPSVVLSFDDNVAEFSHYEYREVTASGVAGPWTDLSDDALEWKPRPNVPRVEVRALNVRDVAGPMAAVEARFE